MGSARLVQFYSQIPVSGSTPKSTAIFHRLLPVRKNILYTQISCQSQFPNKYDRLKWDGLQILISCLMGE